MKVSLPYIHEYRDRTGTVRRYFRRPGTPLLPLPGVPGSPEFIEAYNAALADCIVRKPAPLAPSSPGTLSAAIAEYYQHNSFLGLAPGTRAMRRAILERFRAQDGEKRIAKLETTHVAKRLGAMRPFAARNWLKALRGLMQFAVAMGLRSDDPTASFKLKKARAGTIHTWTEDEISAFENTFAVGTRPRLAMALLLYTAARRGDAIRLGRQHIRNGRIAYRQQKTGRTLEIPIHPRLADILNALPANNLSFLVTARGKPFTAAGFGNWFRATCNEAGLPQCSAHGLRKAQARRLAEAGCSAHQIAAITGHRTLSEVQRYAADAEQARMADDAIRTVSRTGLANDRDALANRHATD